MVDRPARLLFLNSRSEYGGADMGLLGIVRHLDPERFTPLVILPQEGPLVSDLEGAGAQVIYLDICRLERLASPAQILLFVWSFVQSLWGLLSIIRKERIDLIYTNSSAIQVGALAARLAGIPNVWHIREIWTEPHWLTKPLYRYVYALANRIIAISHAVAEGNFGHAQGKIHVVRDGIDLSRFGNLDRRSDLLLQRYGLDRSLPIVTTVARVVPQKGLTTFVEAARYVRDAGVNARFCLAGDIPRPMYQGYKDDLKQEIARNHLEDRVHLLGWSDDTPALLHASDLFVLASIGPEGAGLVIPEAWLSGIPAIGPNHTGPAELIQYGENGFLFETGNAKDLGEKIVTMLRDAEALRRMAANGRRDALEKHDAGRNTTQIENVMTDLLKLRSK
jgi:glycosyltransferase involved in cell wall biosynthesis